MARETAGSPEREEAARSASSAAATPAEEEGGAAAMGERAALLGFASWEEDGGVGSTGV